MSLRKNHLTIAGVLFAIAITLYVIGFTSGAVVVSVLAIVVEIAAWIALLSDRSEGSVPGGKP
ncbi:hypothetical protein DSM104443_00265 [Usitatibacter rugosus]|uniref:Uncharacterized protein n=1 Tax=Usitatibacter rugosus TaxID=2732067 RepID=A0A6M4GR24_9PROT|nr:hypothetical protein [Usitatibacter rugosus]QJR09228.1 hypothetical protein DSM104443_00265 [Usitatibacter rugosus]